MLRKNSRWQNWFPTYGCPRKRNDRAYEKRQWQMEASSDMMDSEKSRYGPSVGG